MGEHCIFSEDSSSRKTHALISRLNKYRNITWSVLHFHAFHPKTTKAFAKSDYVSCAATLKRGKIVRWLWCRWLNWCKESLGARLYELHSHLWWQYGHKDLLQITQSSCGKAWHEINSNSFVLAWPPWAGFHYAAFLISLSLKYRTRSDNEILWNVKSSSELPKSFFKKAWFSDRILCY